jgi:hypothetical protein
MPTKPLGVLLEDLAFQRSTEDDRRRPAASGSLALQRVHQRAAQRQRAKS